VIREGKRKNVELTVGAIPDEDKELGALPKSGAESSSNRLGVSVVELTPSRRKPTTSKAVW
jgi:serine protease Do